MPAATRDDLSEPIESTDLLGAAHPSKAKPGLWGSTLEVFNKFSDDDGMTQAAALAFYTGLALAPLLTVLVWIATLVLGTLQKANADQVLSDIGGVATNVLGAKAAAPIQDLLKPASAQAGGMTLTGVLSVLFLAFTASSVLAQLQASLNIIWHVKADPKISGIVDLIRKRVFSFGMLFTLLFLLLVSMMVSVMIEAVFSGKEERAHLTTVAAPTTAAVTRAVSMPMDPIAATTQLAAATTAASAESHEIAAATQAVEDAQESRLIFRIINLGVSFIVAVGVFMLLFTYLPDARVPWRDTLLGATLTALLFLLGRYAMGIYLGRGSYETSYGAAVGSFVALLVWVYYTSVIIFIGVEATYVWARRHGRHPRAEKHAVRTERFEKTIA